MLKIRTTHESGSGLIPMRESPGLRTIVVAHHTLLELLVWEMGD